MKSALLKRLSNFIGNNEPDGSAFSAIDPVGQCLADIERTELFKKAIEEVVKSGDTVIDIGTGSAIMAIFAAKAGAKKVFALEYDPYIHSVAAHNIKINGLESVIEILHGDARSCSFPQGVKFDVVIMEMLTTGMIDEYQMQAINNLYEKGVVHRDTKFIPEIQETYITPVTFNKDFFGAKIEMPLHLWKWSGDLQSRVQPLADALLVDSQKFLAPETIERRETLSFTITRPGELDGFLVSSKSVLNSNYTLGDTEALNAPIYIPCTTRNVEGKLDVDVVWEYGGGFGSYNIIIS